MSVFDNFYLNIKLVNDNAKMPDQSGDVGNAGYEFYAVEDVTLTPGQEALIPSGWCCEFPAGFVMVIKDKSGRRWKGKLQTGAGVIDSTYRNEVMVLMKNIGNEYVTIKKGEKVAQFMILPCWNGAPRQVEELDMDNDRGGGFGHTGLK